MCYGMGCKWENQSIGEGGGECRKPSFVKCPMAEEEAANTIDDEDYYCSVRGIDGDACPRPASERSPLRCSRCENERATNV
jgi:hypothetical protein